MAKIEMGGVETVEVRYDSAGTVLSESWAGKVHELQILRGGRGRVRIDTEHGAVSVLYGQVHRMVRRSGRG